MYNYSLRQIGFREGDWPMEPYEAIRVEIIKIRREDVITASSETEIPTGTEGDILMPEVP